MDAETRHVCAGIRQGFFANRFEKFFQPVGTFKLDDGTGQGGVVIQCWNWSLPPWRLDEECPSTDDNSRFPAPSSLTNLSSSSPSWLPSAVFNFSFCSPGDAYRHPHSASTTFSSRSRLALEPLAASLGHGHLASQFNNHFDSSEGADEIPEMRRQMLTGWTLFAILALATTEFLKVGILGQEGQRQDRTAISRRRFWGCLFVCLVYLDEKHHKKQASCFCNEGYEDEMFYTLGDGAVAVAVAVAVAAWMDARLLDCCVPFTLSSLPLTTPFVGFCQHPFT
ncbi:hypothetical protein VTJ04DRAFT_2165 [Mycothermus thermophilus]|uniref:uncharacterized protein n=1 Tax=Humicola insolens TaxID=85995 RepID=UPI00374326B0